MRSFDVAMEDGKGAPVPPSGLASRPSFDLGGAVEPGSCDRLERADLGRNLTAGVVDALGMAIATGSFDDVPFPTEAALARHFSVSHSVIREATKMLAAKGLLAARPRQGTIVRPQNAWSLFDADVLRWILKHRLSGNLHRQLIELLLAIEPSAAALAARSRSQAGLAMIERAYQRLAAADAGDKQHLEFQMAFHVAIFSACENPFYARFRDVVYAVLSAEGQTWKGSLSSALGRDRYRIVVRSIADGDETQAYDAVKQLVLSIAAAGKAATTGKL